MTQHVAATPLDRPLLAPAPARAVGLLVGIALLVVCGLASLLYGTMDVAAADVWKALWAYDGGSSLHVVVASVRVPRALIAAAVGGSLAVAGALMQGVTRNPLAAPGILGVNAGAALVVVLAVFLLRVDDLAVYAWFAFLGAAVAAGLVYLLGAVGRGSGPLRLVVAGAAVSALFTSLTTATLLVSERGLDEVRFWLAGSVVGRDLALFWMVAPYLAIGMVGALLMGRQITTLSLGEDVARGLGQRTAWVKVAAAGSVVLLAGGAVAVAGPIGFVGLVVPHVVRFFVGVDYRWILPYSAVGGAILLLAADVVARLVVRPQEVPVGVVTALIGGPFFAYLVWTRVKR